MEQDFPGNMQNDVNLQQNYEQHIPKEQQGSEVGWFIKNQRIFHMHIF